MHNRLGHRFTRRAEIPIWIESKQHNAGMTEENNNPCPSGDPLYAYLQDSGSPDMDVNASIASPRVFENIVPPNQTLELHRLNLYIVDGNVRWDRFGARNRLPNGLLIQVLDDGANVVQHFGTDAEPIRNNADFSVLGEVQLSRISGPDVLILNWDLIMPMCLETDWSFRFVLQDNLSGLDFFRAMIQGLLHSNP